MEATRFTSWIYDHLKPLAAALKVAHPLMLRAIAAAKKKNDHINANKICDCLRCDFLPGCYMASAAIRERRRTLRYRNLLVRQMVQMKIKISSLLMEAGISYSKQRLHKAGYFRELLATNPHIDDGLRSLLRQCREMVVRLSKLESGLVRSLQHDPLLLERVERLMSIPGVGPVTALATDLSLGDPRGFADGNALASYVVIITREYSSGGRERLGGLTKQGIPLLRFLWGEAAAHAVCRDPELQRSYHRKLMQKGLGKATMAVACKLGIRLWVMLRDEID